MAFKGKHDPFLWPFFVVYLLKTITTTTIKTPQVAWQLFFLVAKNPN
jgi:hypothetical protein